MINSLPQLAHIFQGPKGEEFIKLLSRLDQLVGTAQELCPDGEPREIKDDTEEQQFFQCHKEYYEILANMASLFDHQGSHAMGILRMSLSHYSYGIPFDKLKLWAQTHDE